MVCRKGLRIQFQPQWIPYSTRHVPAFAQPVPSLIFSMIEHTHSSLPTDVNLVSPEDWVTLSLDPDPCHCVVKNLIFFYKTKTLNKVRLPSRTNNWGTGGGGEGGRRRIPVSSHFSVLPLLPTEEPCQLSNCILLHWQTRPRFPSITFWHLTNIWRILAYKLHNMQKGNNSLGCLQFCQRPHSHNFILNLQTSMCSSLL